MKLALNYYFRGSNYLNLLVPALDVALRIYLAQVFFKSGWTKTLSWDSTLYLFAEEYKVPLLNPEFAAYLATSAELALPVLLVLGLFGRLAALGLFILNAVALYSYYPQLSEAGIQQHLFWGMLLAVLLVHGLGKWAVDSYLEQRVAS